MFLISFKLPPVRNLPHIPTIGRKLVLLVRHKGQQFVFVLVYDVQPCSLDGGIVDNNDFTNTHEEFDLFEWFSGLVVQGDSNLADRFLGPSKDRNVDIGKVHVGFRHVLTSNLRNRENETERQGET